MFSYIDRNRGRPRCRGVEPHRQGTHVPRILVADDNTNIQKMVALAFHDRGIDVTSVGNGEAAIRRLPDLNPDLILADIFMPVRNGYEVCEWVKKDPKFSHIPVILLVGAFDPLDEKEARRVGADGVLKKPFIPPDPLIAMVTSVLEKNSKIASETAKAQEIVAAPTPIPVAAAQTPVRVEATPVPEFPEPNPEETPLVYAFGSGRRTLDDEGSGEPAGSPGPSAEIHQEPEEEFEGASTTKDWRRSAMEFEIPEETSRNPVFSSDEDADPTFPSEKNVAPKRTRIPQAAEEIEPVMQQLSAPAPADRSPVVAKAVGHLETTIAPEASEPPSDQTTKIEIHDAPASESHAIPEPSFASKAAHWMDLMASPAGQPRGDWFTSTLGSRTHGGKQETPSETAASLHPVVAQEPRPELNAGAETPVVEECVQVASPDEEPFFADETDASAPALGVVSATDEAPAVSNDPEVPAKITAEVHAEVHAIDEPVAHDRHQAASDAVASIPAQTSAELVAEVFDEPTLAKDPHLVEPLAVRVTPDPLLIDESPRGSLTYATREQETTPLYSFLSAMPKTPAPAEIPEEPTAALSMGDQPRAEGFPAEEDPAGPLEFSSSEFDTPIPTGPPPNRESLAAIPFLNPPPAFHQSEFSSDREDSQSTSAATVDTIVQKVLEKLEPQIRELLSENVLRPLVEDLLHGELEKKNR